MDTGFHALVVFYMLVSALALVSIATSLVIIARKEK